MSEETTKKLQLKVEGMSCGHCEMTVVNRFKSVPGAQDATADKDTGSAVVTYDSNRAKPEDFIEALEGTNYSASPAE